ncbi:MAG: hypothetical protein AUH25_02030 [Thaumarchaeota archaeon 13_1_40CM_38_12]|nr:MAG: hypothetical protein AUH25_02030 [Thaumarchaeota archaeon 13_1_40CM_38_12]OLD41000.1 MAG: hypothetical protein AUI60_03025 [Thaumarchaeota archaeon 13_1_40CM_2_39_4]
MVEGQTGLNIKDYPFAFSVAVLFAPNLLSDPSNNHAILGILLIGGILGSLLTIINPLGLLIKYYYTREYSSQIYHIIFPSMFPVKNNMIKNIAEKNFRSALTTPAISFEIDKIVAMIYFIIILGVAIIRIFLGDLTSILKDNPYLIPIVVTLSVAGLVGVLLVLIRHVYGINFKREKLEFRSMNLKTLQQTTLSQLDRIRLVTIANLAIDYANLSNEIDKWRSYGLEIQPLRQGVLEAFYKLDSSVAKSFASKKWTTDYSHFKEFVQKEIKDLYATNNYTLNAGIMQYLFQRYSSLREISLRYDVEFSEALAWMYDLTAESLLVLYEIEPQVRTSIESRDWDNADLIVYRITDRLENFLRIKNIPSKITEKPII